MRELLAPPLSGRNETELERCDRHLSELMQEVRVAQAGVQVLFGFLLIVPFSAGFGQLGAGDRRLYCATLVLSGAAALLLTAPSAHHRILFRCGDKPHLVRTANRYAMAGLTCVALAMAGAITLIGTVVLADAYVGVVGAATALASIWCWYGVPLRRRRWLIAQKQQELEAPQLSLSHAIARDARPGGTTCPPSNSS